MRLRRGAITRRRRRPVVVNRWALGKKFLSLDGVDFSLELDRISTFSLFEKVYDR